MRYFFSVAKLLNIQSCEYKQIGKSKVSDVLCQWMGTPIFGCPVRKKISFTNNLRISNNTQAQVYWEAKDSDGFPVGSGVMNMPAKQRTQLQFLGQEDPVEKAMATHFSILAWKIPWTEEPGGLQSLGSPMRLQELNMTYWLNNNTDGETSQPHMS